MLSEQQISDYRANGYIVVRGAISSKRLSSLLTELDGWIEESRSRTENWGSLPNGKPMFDLEVGHSVESPRLRRVASPCDISADYKDFIWNGPIADLVAQLIGPNVKFMECRINLKLPGMAVYLDYHQDHAYNPHTNPDVVTTFVLLDTMTEENGCLKLVPGSHKSRYSHFNGDTFTGSIGKEHFAAFEEAAVPVTGEPGDVILMNTWCVHGSGVNRASIPRRLMITDFLAADAFPLSPLNTLSIHTGEIVRGTPTRVARLEQCVVEMPQSSMENSFFSLPHERIRKTSAQP